MKARVLLFALVASVTATAAVAAQISEPTTVILVRHAEKAEDGRDPPLSAVGQARAERLVHVLSELDLEAIYATEYRRTAETVAPVAARFGLPVRTAEARDVSGLAARLRSEHRGQVVLVAGHSNTVPELIAAILGRDVLVEITEEEYDDLFVVRLEPDGRASYLRLNYGGS